MRTIRDSTTQRPRRTESSPTHLRGTLGAVTLLGALLAIASLAGAGAAGTTTLKFSAPFTGFGYANTSQSSSVCGTDSFPRAPSAGATSGDLNGSALTSSSTSCNKANVTSSGFAYFDDHLQTQLGKAPKNGAQQVVVTYTISYKANLTSKAGSSSGSASVYDELVLFPELFDAKNGSEMLPTGQTASYVSYYVYGTSASHHGTQTWTFYWNATKLTTAHTYVLTTDLWVYDQASTTGPKATASGSMAIAGSALRSITVS
jgi:hypothetical protein